jgi:signal transduction histidine kinase
MKLGNPHFVDWLLRGEAPAGVAVRAPPPARTPRPLPGAYFVGLDDEPRRWSARQILDAIDDGRLELDTPIRPSPERPAAPLRRYLRELVFVAHHQSRESSGAADGPEQRFQRAFFEAPVPCALSDLSGRVRDVNDAFCELLGRPAATLVGTLVGDITHESGEAIPCRVHISLVRDDDGHPREAFAMVLDRRGPLALEALRARKAGVVAVQNAARRLAHDFGNALFVVRTASELLDESTTLSDEERAHVAAVREASDLCGRMVQQLRTLSDAGAEPVMTLDLVEAVRARVQLLKRSVPEGVRLSVEVPDEPVQARLDAGSLDRILLNLVSNAGHHTPEGGAIVVSVTRTPLGALLRVQDNGVGMTDEVRQQALEPFFTARPNGSGLGLAIVNTAVTRAGGTVTIHSSLGSGTAVEIRLPRPIMD